MAMTNKGKGTLCIVGAGLNLAINNFIYTLVILFMTPMCIALSANSVEAAMIFTMSSISGMIVSLVLGPALVKWNPKILYTIGGVISAGFLVWMMYAPNIIAIWIGAFVWGFGSKMLGALPYQVIVTNWLKQGTSTVSTLASLVGNALNAAFSPIVAILITSMGAQQAALMIGGVLLAVMLVLDIFLVCKVPSAYGMEPITLFKEKKTDDSKPAKKRHIQEIDDYDLAMPTRNFFKLPAFYLLMLGPFLVTFAMQMYYPNIATINTEVCGLDLVASATVISIGSVLSMVLQPLFGLASDTFGSKASITIWGGIAAVGLLGFMVFQNWGFIGAVCMIAANKFCTINNYMGVTTFPFVFGKKAGATLISWGNIMAGLASTLAPIFASAIYAATGSFTIAFIIGGLGLVLTIVIAHVALSPKMKNSVREADKPFKEAELAANAQ